MDDSFILGDSLEECYRAVDWLTRKLTTLGFVVHPEKSMFKPNTTLVFLGYRLCSITMTVSPTEKKIEKVSEKISNLIKGVWVGIREVASVAGLLNDVCKAVDYGLAHTKFLEMDKITGLRRAGARQFDGVMTISDKARSDLTWWLDNIKWRSRKIRASAPRLTLTTDASTLGWGAVWMENRTGGRWSQEEALLHINVLELRAVWLGLCTFCSELREIDIRIESDNTTTVTYINNQGGTHSTECNEQARLIWDWCEVRGIWLMATHLPGKLNEVADFESRNFTENTEWQLNPEIFESLCEKWGTPDVDLFASRLNNQVPCYASWGLDPFCSFVNAFSQNWSDFNLCYLFPPFRLLPRCLQKLKEERGRAIVVAPNWPGQPWWSVLTKQGRDRLEFKKKKGNLINTSGTAKGRTLEDIKLLAVLI